jgi:hypothetical protein
LTEIATQQVKTYFQNQTEESFKHYTAYAASCALMSDALGGDYIPSVIEQPLLDLVRANAPIGGVPLDRIQEVFAKHLQKAIGDVRKLWLETWRMPAIGIMILGQSKSLDEVPTKITEARDRFAKLRESIISLERQRRAAVEEGEGGMVEIYKLDEEIKAAFAAFADKVDDKRTQSGVTRNERIVSGLGLLRGLAPEVLKIAGGKITAAAFGSLGKVLDTLEFDLNVKRCLNLRLIKGLYSAATFFNLEDVRAVRGVDAIVFRHLNASELLILRQRELLRNAFELCLRMALGPDPNDAYGRYKVVGGPGEEALEVESPRLWWLMASNDRLSKRLTEE